MTDSVSGAESLAVAPIKTALNQQETNGKLAVGLIEAVTLPQAQTVSAPEGLKGGFVDTRA